jgi:hypothetical protein
LYDTINQNTTTTIVTTTATILKNASSNLSPKSPEANPKVPFVSFDQQRAIPRGKVNAHHPKLNEILPCRSLINNPENAMKIQTKAHPHITRPIKRLPVTQISASPGEKYPAFPPLKAEKD